MEKKSVMMMTMPSLLLWSLVLSQSLLTPVMSSTSFEDQKNYYYPPDPHTGTPPIGGSPPYTPTPHTPTPYTPTPHTPTPYTPTPHTPTPYTPTPHTPTPHHSTPPHGDPPHGGCGGCHGHTPSTPVPTPHTPPNCPTPTTPTDPTPTPTVPYTPTPTTPYTPTPTTPYTPTPTTPYTPTPVVPTPSTPPYIPDPNTPPFTCNYWRNHPQMIWGVLGWWGTLGNAFGVPTVPGVGANVNLKDALSNTRTDGFGELCRQGTAAFLNSMVDHSFTYSAKQVRESFVNALGSDKAAAAQARLFKIANEKKH
ncbi:protodermal factor 1 isoform X2 [Humulus lupulus]|uniref:protodermal factor 1 isoform X2 n=1 Tax=Humulus lupulus TaxID=3486 RepID=UPI002B408E00|nr:protodermal factor 1 isoform X2 [Humulus lupulus]